MYELLDYITVIWSFSLLTMGLAIVGYHLIGEAMAERHYWKEKEKWDRQLYEGKQ